MDQERAFPTSRKFLYLVGALAVLFTMTISIWFYRSIQPKEVHFVINGETKVIKTKAKTVGDLLKEQSIQLTDYDQLSPPSEQKIQAGLEVNFEEKWQVAIDIGKDEKKVVTGKKVVGDILKEQNIALGSADKVNPGLDNEISDNSKISITKVEQKVVESEETIPFREVKRSDLLLAQGQEKVVQDGVNGKAVLRYQVVYENGEEVSRTLVDTQVVQPMQEKIIKIGTLATVSRGGTDFTARKVIENVVLTAYGPGGNSHTASGSKPNSGQTIAADPDVIPLGTWVYIEGYGFKRVEDTGGAIKGNKLDLYFDNDQDAKDFGVRRASKVYVIGSSHP
ncbi:MAG TPA: ubiquitin-like domain-containing protein [Bacillota bacterium]|nr:ubiquitin-like domain-containing protein [Bacillota bacterium]